MYLSFSFATLGKLSRQHDDKRHLRFVPRFRASTVTPPSHGCPNCVMCQCHIVVFACVLISLPSASLRHLRPADLAVYCKPISFRYTRNCFRELQNGSGEDASRPTFTVSNSTYDLCPRSKCSTSASSFLQIQTVLQSNLHVSHSYK